MSTVQGMTDMAAGASAGITDEQLAAARKTVANYIARNGGDPDDLLMLLTSLGICDDSLVFRPEVEQTATTVAANEPMRTTGTDVIARPMPRSAAGTLRRR
jgi:ribosomal protein L16/L10AE